VLLDDLKLPKPSTGDAKGHVLLLVLLDAMGVVRDVSVVDATPRNLYDEHMLDAFRRLRFSPAMRNDRPVRSRLMIQLEYGGDDGATR
jgi:TonB family protein